MILKTMDEGRKFYIQYPKKEFIVVVVVILCQFVLLFLLPNNIFIIIWINIVELFFGYHLLVLLLTNMFKRSYMLFNARGITFVNHFNMRKEYLWNDYKGYILVENIIFLRIGNKNVKINNDNLRDGNINEIINIIEENKVSIKY